MLQTYTRGARKNRLYEAVQTSIHNLLLNTKINVYPYISQSSLYKPVFKVGWFSAYIK